MRENFEKLRKLRLQIKKAVELEEIAKSAAERMTSILTPTPKGKGNASRVELFSIKALEAQQRRAELQADYMLLQMDITREIMERIFEPVACSILVARYVEGRPWKEIIYSLDCSPRQVYRLHKEGLQALEGSPIRDSA